jgi:hypothetical protein
MVSILSFMAARGATLSARQQRAIDALVVDPSHPASEDLVFDVGLLNKPPVLTKPDFKGALLGAQLAARRCVFEVSDRWQIDDARSCVNPQSGESCHESDSLAPTKRAEGYTKEMVSILSFSIPTPRPVILRHTPAELSGECGRQRETKGAF